MESADQRIAENNTFHKASRQEARVLMLHILSINDNLALGGGGVGINRGEKTLRQDEAWAFNTTTPFKTNKRSRQRHVNVPSRSVPDSTLWATTLHFRAKLLKAIKKSSRFLLS